MGLQVMMVDDDELVIYLQTIFLEKAGISSEPVVAYSGSEALEYIKSISDSDLRILLFLDINMPDMTGWEVLDKINEWSLSENILVVIVTSSVNINDKLKAGTYDNVIYFLEKPISKGDFLELKSLEAISAYFG